MFDVQTKKQMKIAEICFSFGDLSIVCIIECKKSVGTYIETFEIV